MATSYFDSRSTTTSMNADREEEYSEDEIAEFTLESVTEQV